MRRLGRIVAIVVALAVAVVAVVLIVRVEDVDRALRGDERPPGGEGPPPPTRSAPMPDGFLEPPADEFAGLVGREVRARAALVESVEGARGFWIGPARDERVFVRTEQRARVAAGEHVDVDGVIAAASGATARELGLEGADAASLREVAALIDARRVSAAAGR